MSQSTNILNLSNVPDDCIDDPQFQTKMRTYLLGKAAGSEKLYVNIDQVKPGGKSVKYHAHSTQEEFFLILGGSGILRMNNEEFAVAKGDFVAKPAGKGIAHQFINTGTEILEILDCGLKTDDDVATYPDEEIVFMRKSGLVFKRSDAISGWSSDPNE